MAHVARYPTMPKRLHGVDAVESCCCCKARQLASGLVRALSVVGAMAARLQEVAGRCRSAARTRSTQNQLHIDCNSSLGQPVGTNNNFHQL